MHHEDDGSCRCYGGGWFGCFVLGTGAGLAILGLILAVLAAISAAQGAMGRSDALQIAIWPSIVCGLALILTAAIMFYRQGGCWDCCEWDDEGPNATLHASKP